MLPAKKYSRRDILISGSILVSGLLLPFRKVCNASPDSSELMKDIRQELGKIRMVDAHEHLPDEKDWLKNPENKDFTSLLGYVRWNLVSAVEHRLRCNDPYA